MQGIQYFALKYLGVHLSNLEKILLARAKYSILCTLIHGGPYIQLWKNTYCTCKVFNTLHLNTWGSIYPTSKKYFLHVQSIKYFAPKYLGVHISNFKKYFLHVQSIQYFAPKYMGVDIYPTSKKYFLHLQSIAPEYQGVHISNFKKNTSCTCKVFNNLHLDELTP